MKESFVSSKDKDRTKIDEQKNRKQLISSTEPLNESIPEDIGTENNVASGKYFVMVISALCVMFGGYSLVSSKDSDLVYREMESSKDSDLIYREMVLVQSGSFTMGCTSEQESYCNGDEKPSHKVTLSRSFYIGQYEVTQDYYKGNNGREPEFFSRLWRQLSSGECKLV